MLNTMSLPLWMNWRIKSNTKYILNHIIYIVTLKFDDEIGENRRKQAIVESAKHSAKYEKRKMLTNASVSQSGSFFSPTKPSNSNVRKNIQVNWAESKKKQQRIAIGYG